MEKIKLDELSTRAPAEVDKEKIKIKTAALLAELDELQNLLFAEGKHSVLVVLQGLDACGKDGAIRNVFGKLNPLGVMVKSFKVPTPEEQAHDFLWRVHATVPAKGMICIFNRSHYEDILVTRVHGWCDDDTAAKRMKAINDFEELLQQHNQTHILKFYLHVSAEEQHRRLMERMQEPGKMWKYNAQDFEEAKLWHQYRKAYEDCFEQCNKIPWTIVPADQNWYKEYVIASTLCGLLQRLDMKYPGLKKKTFIFPYQSKKFLHSKILFMGMLKEFKEFAIRGNVIDLAVGVVIGAAFGAIVGAVVDHILMPAVGMITGGIDFDTLTVKVGDAELNYGLAITAVVKFLAIVLFLFFFIKAINTAKKKEAPAAPPATPEDILLLREIRDALKK